MLQRVLAGVLSLAILVGANPVLFAAAPAGQISGVAMLQSGAIGLYRVYACLPQADQART